MPLKSHLIGEFVCHAYQSRTRANECDRLKGRHWSRTCHALSHSFALVLVRILCDNVRGSKKFVCGTEYVGLYARQRNCEVPTWYSLTVQCHCKNVKIVEPVSPSQAPAPRKKQSPVQSSAIRRTLRPRQGVWGDEGTTTAHYFVAILA